jgi:hypothetical protein
MGKKKVSRKHWTVADMVTLIKCYNGIGKYDAKESLWSVAKLVNRTPAACTFKYMKIIDTTRKHSFAGSTLRVMSSCAESRMLKAYAIYAKAVGKLTTSASSTSADSTTSNTSTTRPTRLKSQAVFVTWYCKLDLTNKFKKICVPSSYGDTQKDEYVSSFLSKLGLTKDNCNNLAVWNAAKLKVVEEAYTIVAFKIKL